MIALRQLCFTGPEKPPARVGFGSGLNVIYGASDTGKSFMFQALDFMLGSQVELEDIPERVGYDRIFLGLEVDGDNLFTLVRAITGGEFHLYEGLHESVPDGIEPVVLGSKHNQRKESNVSRLLLGKVGLDERLVRKNKNNETRGLSFRDICHLCLVSETDIQKRGSPLETGQYTNKTAEYSVFKLLLTGVDDSALVAAERASAASQARAAKVELVDEMIAALEERIEESGEIRSELSSQLERIGVSIDRDQESLQAYEGEYRELLHRRRELQRRFEHGTERRGEIDELLARFGLLDEHYRSDLARLEAIREAGSLFAGLPEQACPLCGALVEHQHKGLGFVEEDFENVLVAAEAESAKIVRLRRELAETVRQLRAEADSFDLLLPRLSADAEGLLGRLDDLRPGLADQRASYAELIGERSAVVASLGLFEQLDELRERRERLEGTEGGASEGDDSATHLSSTTLDEFAQFVEGVLKRWGFPGAERVHFEERDRDLVIFGKRRKARGKGMRAITHAAFTIGLMGFCRSQDRRHPGFVVLDSPLLAYREPEGEEDDLAGTDLHERFYADLAAMADLQVIILENLTPPTSIRERPSTTFFTKNPHQGRYGLFPMLDAPE